MRRRFLTRSFATNAPTSLELKSNSTRTLRDDAQKRETKRRGERRRRRRLQAINDKLECAVDAVACRYWNRNARGQLLSNSNSNSSRLLELFETTLIKERVEAKRRITTRRRRRRRHLFAAAWLAWLVVVVVVVLVDAAAAFAYLRKELKNYLNIAF